MKIVIFEDHSQRATLSLIKKSKDYYELQQEMISVKTKEIQMCESMELHKNELLKMANWVIENIK